MLRSRSNTLKTNKSGVDMIFVLTVFVLFVCCLLAAVLAFAKAYKHFGSSAVMTAAQYPSASREIRIISAFRIR